MPGTLSAMTLTANCYGLRSGGRLYRSRLFDRRREPPKRAKDRNVPNVAGWAPTAWHTLASSGTAAYESWNSLVMACLGEQESAPVGVETS